jgi:hypothetical protein
MMLPQGTAYATLRDRLTSVTSLHIAVAGAGRLAPASVSVTSPAAAAASSSSGALGSTGGSSVDLEQLYAFFVDSQRRQRSALSADLRARSILVRYQQLQAQAGAGAGTGGKVAAAPVGGGSGGVPAGQRASSNLGATADASSSRRQAAPAGGSGTAAAPGALGSAAGGGASSGYGTSSLHPDLGDGLGLSSGSPMERQQGGLAGVGVDMEGLLAFGGAATDGLDALPGGDADDDAGRGDADARPAKASRAPPPPPRQGAGGAADAALLSSLRTDESTGLTSLSRGRGGSNASGDGQ